jgi:hypothetical protein
MLSYEVYKILHIFGLAGVFASLGGLTLHALNGGSREDNSSRKLLVITNGTCLLFMLVGGMGMLARLGMASSMPAWVWLKFLLWGGVGALMSVVMRKPDTAKVIWFLLPVLAALGAGIALYKPLG